MKITEDRPLRISWATEGWSYSLSACCPPFCLDVKPGSLARESAAEREVHHSSTYVIYYLYYIYFTFIKAAESIWWRTHTHTHTKWQSQEVKRKVLIHSIFLWLRKVLTRLCQSGLPSRHPHETALSILIKRVAAFRAMRKKWWKRNFVNLHSRSEHGLLRWNQRQLIC